MHPEQLALMIPIFSVLGFFTMVIFLRRYSNIERMSMIERGMNPSELKTFSPRRRRDPHRAVRFACAAIGIGIGLFTGNLLRAFDLFDRGGIVAGLVFLFGGIGLLVGYFVQISLQKQAKVVEEEMDEHI